jgi:hypothetical protein
MESLYERVKGGLMFFLMAVAIYFNVFDKDWSISLGQAFSFLKLKLHDLSSTVPWLLPVGTPITFPTFKWTLTAIVVNLVTIVFAIIDILMRRDRRGLDIIVALLLGMLIVFHIVAFPVSITERFNFNSIVIITYLVYLITDILGMRRLAHQGQAHEYPLYYYPACCLDGPTFLVILVFIIASYLTPITKDFYDGIGAGILLLSGFVYAGLLGFVIPERRVHVQN